MGGKKYINMGLGKERNTWQGGKEIAKTLAQGSKEICGGRKELD